MGVGRCVTGRRHVRLIYCGTVFRVGMDLAVRLGCREDYKIAASA